MRVCMFKNAKGTKRKYFKRHKMFKSFSFVSKRKEHHINDPEMKKIINNLSFISIVDTIKGAQRNRNRYNTCYERIQNNRS